MRSESEEDVEDVGQLNTVSDGMYTRQTWETKVSIRNRLDQEIARTPQKHDKLRLSRTPHYKIIDVRELRRLVGKNNRINVETFPGASGEGMEFYVQPALDKGVRPIRIIAHAEPIIS